MRDKATQGEWKSVSAPCDDKYGHFNLIRFDKAHHYQAFIERDEEDGESVTHDDRQNFAFITAAANFDIPSAIATIERLESFVKKTAFADQSLTNAEAGAILRSVCIAHADLIASLPDDAEGGA